MFNYGLLVPYSIISAVFNSALFNYTLNFAILTGRESDQQPRRANVGGIQIIGPTHRMQS